MNRTLSLRTRLIMSLVIVTVLVLVIFGAGTLQARATNNDVQDINESAVPSLVSVEAVELHTEEMLFEVNLYGFLYTLAQSTNELDNQQAELDDTRAEFELVYQQAKTAVQDFRDVAEDPGEQQRIRDIETLIDRIYLGGNDIFRVVQLGDTNPIVLARATDILVLEEEVKTQIEELRAIELEEFTDTQDRVVDRSNQTGILNAAVLAIALSILGLVGWNVIGRVIRPIHELEKATIALQTGNFDHRIHLPHEDELGQLGNAFNSMASSIQRRDNELRDVNTKLESQLDETDKARQTAERSDQVKSAFLASMSHELRTPLNSIINFTKFVVKGMMGPVTEEQTNTLNEVIDSAKHLLNLINDVLDMSKIESGSLRLFVEDNVNIQAVLDQVVSTGKSLIVDKTVTIETEIKADLPTIRGDRQRLLQILLNIMSNACKFTESGQIMVRATQEDGKLNISIQDSGPGIEPADQPAVFEPFKQTNAGLRQGGGTGLGMPISKSLTEAHGGKLWLESTPGQGSTFHVLLPIQSQQLTPVKTSGGV